MSMRKLVLVVAALAMVMALAACGSSGDSSGGDQKQDNKSSEKSKNEQAGSDKEKADKEKAGKKEKGAKRKKTIAEVPEDKTLGLTIPKLDKEIEGIPTGRGDDTQLLEDNAAVHLLYTGFPWQRVANVYLAGHVEGYEGTPSYKAFEGLKTLENGDEVIVNDADGKEYVYEIYEKRVVQPTDVEVLDRVPGKNIVTLQTCELVNVDENGNPDYSNTERLVVRGELKDVKS
ncbi:MAG: class E sortase [Actinomycetota bacterium]|nr:class E sortase [Actinomycetota bacterium]